jgi:hypothetical protein
MYTLAAGSVTEPEMDMKREAAMGPTAMGRLRVIFKRLPLFSREIVAPRRAVDREIEELYHPFD